MSLARDLAWRNLDIWYRSSVAYKLARYALGLSYEMLPQDVVHQAKRCLLDTLGCAIGTCALKADAPGRPILEAVVKELGGPQEATVFGSGLRISAPNATLMNSFLVRFLDFNDMTGEGNHNSDGIPAILATCEREKTGGRDMLTSLVISYEIGDRVRESYAGEKGWTNEIRGGLSLPPALGKLMGLSEEQIANAVGICAGGSLPLGVLDPHDHEPSMRKNLRMGWVAHDAILSCLLARGGFTGPVRVVEGDSGLRETALQGDMDLERLTDFSGWRIRNVWHKYFCAAAKVHGSVSASIDIVKEHGLKPEDIAGVRITARRPADLAMKYPRNAETADHTVIYTNAYAIKERTLDINMTRLRNFTDPVITDLIEKITTEADPNMTRWGGKSEITTKDGRTFEKRVDNPHGFVTDPLTDKELEEKFSEMAKKYMPKKQLEQIFDTVWNVEKLDDIRKLTALMIVH